MFDGLSNVSNMLQSTQSPINFEQCDRNGDNHFLQLIKKGDVKAADAIMYQRNKTIRGIERLLSSLGWMSEPLLR